MAGSKAGPGLMPLGQLQKRLGGGLREDLRLVAPPGSSTPALVREPHTAFRSVRLCAPGSSRHQLTASGAISKAVPRCSSSLGSQPPFLDKLLGGTRGKLFIGASKGEKLVPEGIQSSYCILLPLCVASLAGWFALRFCQFMEGLKRSQIPGLLLCCLCIWCSSC